MTDLDQAIYRTICWFSLMRYPVGAFEIHKWLYAPKGDYSVNDVARALEESDWLKARTAAHQGMYGRASQEELMEWMSLRRERHLDAVAKYKKLTRAAKWFGLAPGVQAVFAVNTLSWWHTKQDSDIDLLIVVKPGHLWTARFLLVLPYALRGKRPGASMKRDPFCFSFFATDRALALSALQLPGGDPYLHFWVKNLVPIFDKAGIAERLERENAWAHSCLPNAKRREGHARLMAKPMAPVFIFAQIFERAFRTLQQLKFPAEIKTSMNQDSRVVVSDNLLKFHVNDRREAMRDAWVKAVTYGS